MTKRWKITIGIVAGLAVVFAIIWTSPIGRFIIKGGLGDLKEPLRTATRPPCESEC